MSVAYKKRRKRSRAVYGPDNRVRNALGTPRSPWEIGNERARRRNRLERMGLCLNQHGALLSIHAVTMAGHVIRDGRVNIP